MNKVYYVVFSNDLTYTHIENAEVWVADKGEHEKKDPNTESTIYDGIVESTNEPSEFVCKKYDIAAIFDKIDELGLLNQFIVE